MASARGTPCQLSGCRAARDIAAGRLPPDTDPDALARFYGSVIQGMSQQARDGASREDLLTVADMALHAWPA